MRGRHPRNWRRSRSVKHNHMASEGHEKWIVTRKPVSIIKCGWSSEKIWLRLVRLFGRHWRRSLIRSVQQSWFALSIFKGICVGDVAMSPSNTFIPLFKQERVEVLDCQTHKQVLLFLPKLQLTCPIIPGPVQSQTRQSPSNDWTHVGHPQKLMAYFTNKVLFHSHAA